MVVLDITATPALPKVEEGVPPPVPVTVTLPPLELTVAWLNRTPTAEPVPSPPRPTIVMLPPVVVMDALVSMFTP